MGRNISLEERQKKRRSDRAKRRRVHPSITVQSVQKIRDVVYPKSTEILENFPAERREASLQSKCWRLVEVSGSRIVREFNEIPAYLRHLTQRRRTYDQSVWINASDCIPIAPACIMRKPRCTFVRCWPTFVHLSIWQLVALRRVTTARVQRSYSVPVSPLWTLWSNTWAGLRVQSQV